MEKSTTQRGFQSSSFKDSNGHECSVQESSSVIPKVWVGVNDPNPKVMANQAAQHGIDTEETTGWVDFPIPGEVSLVTRMHLDKPGLRNLIDELEKYYSEMPDFSEEE